MGQIPLINVQINTLYSYFGSVASNFSSEVVQNRSKKPYRPKMASTKKILIIGAGASGFAAAAKLISNGFKNVLILEAENRIGGRIHTIPFGANVLDMGAQW